MTYAKNLRGKLLIVHGSGDDNVHYQYTETIVNALVAAKFVEENLPAMKRDDLARRVRVELLPHEGLVALPLLDGFGALARVIQRPHQAKGASRGAGRWPREIAFRL